LDPSKHCHAVKQLGGNSDAAEKHVAELTWCLDDGRSRSGCPAVARGGIVDGSACIKVKREEKYKVLSPESGRQGGQRQTECRLASENGTKTKLRSSCNETARSRTEPKSGNKKSETFGKCGNSENPKPAPPSVKSEVPVEVNLDASRSKLLRNGDQISRRKAEFGVISFEETESTNAFSATKPARLMRPRHVDVYREYQAAVVDEYVDKDPGRMISRRMGRDSSDEDVFDLIESGRVSQLFRQSLRPKSNRLRSVSSQHQTVPVEFDRILSKYQTLDRAVDGYESASSADTDIVIRSSRVTSEVAENVRNHTSHPVCGNSESEDNTTGQHGNMDSRQELFNGDGNVLRSPPSSVEESPRTKARRKRRSSASDCSRSLKTVIASTDTSSAQELSTVDGQSSVPEFLPWKVCSSEPKQKQKFSKAGYSEEGVKNDVADSVALTVQQPKSAAVPDVDDVVGKPHKTNVSAFSTHKVATPCVVQCVGAVSVCLCSVLVSRNLRNGLSLLVNRNIINTCLENPEDFSVWLDWQLKSGISYSGTGFLDVHDGFVEYVCHWQKAIILHI